MCWSTVHSFFIFTYRQRKHSYIIELKDSFAAASFTSSTDTETSIMYPDWAQHFDRGKYLFSLKVCHTKITEYISLWRVTREAASLYNVWIGTRRNRKYLCADVWWKEPHQYSRSSRGSASSYFRVIIRRPWVMFPPR